MNNTSDSKSQRCCLYLRGPLRLVNAAGLDCTPKGGFRKALLALLVLSGGHCRGRAWIQSVLWESSNEKRSAAGLRTALSVLRRELKEGLTFDPIRADTQSISIDLDAIWVDIFDDTETEYLDDDGTGRDILEGINLRSTGGENFEEWLRSERQFWADKIRADKKTATHADITTPPRPIVTQICSSDKDPKDRERSPELPPSSSITEKPGEATAAITGGQQGVIQADTSLIKQSKPGIGLLPVIVLSCSPTIQLFADSVLDCIANDLVSFGSIEVYDYRDSRQQSFNHNDGLGPQLLLRIKVAVEDQHFSIHLCTYQATTQKVLGSGSVGGDFKDGLTMDNLIVSGFVAQNVDRILAWFDNTEKSGVNEPGTPYQVLNTMFRFDHHSNAVAAQLLEYSPSDTSASVQVALQAYLQTFLIGEHWGELDSEVYVDTRQLVDRVLAGSCQNPIALCATGHALGFALHEHELALDLLHESVRLGPTQAFCLDHLALAHLYRGEYDKAMMYAKRAIQLGAFSPLRFTYETTICMVATLQGEYETAVFYGKRALSRRPNYGAALRYTSISLAHLNRLDEAAMLLLRTGERDDQFSMDWVEQGRLGVADRNAELTIKNGLTKIGLI